MYLLMWILYQSQARGVHAYTNCELLEGGHSVLGIFDSSIFSVL